MDSPVVTELVRDADGDLAVLVRAIFVVPEGADLTEAEALVEREAVRAAHRYHADLFHPRHRQRVA
jgi:hypothetical protein